jgi:transposase
MSNHLKMAEIESIEMLHRSGHSNRSISRLLSLDRGTVNRFVRLLKSRESAAGRANGSSESTGMAEAAACQNRPNPQTGSDEFLIARAAAESNSGSMLGPNPQAGSCEPAPAIQSGGASIGREDEREDEEPLKGKIGRGSSANPSANSSSLRDGKSSEVQNRPNPRTGLFECPSAIDRAPNLPPGCESDPGAVDVSRPSVIRAVRNGPASLCLSHGEVISRKYEQGLSIQRIHQDLQNEHGFHGSYHSVRRYLLTKGVSIPVPFRRMEAEAGAEAQIDFGTGAPVKSPEGKTRRPWMFRIVLSCSRKAYSEVVWHQTSDNFITAIENAFHYFGGVPKSLVIDNLKAAVAKADWYDPEIHPKLQSFASHYGTVFLPTRPYTPQHKGKVESGVKYAKNNALAGRTFTSLADQNSHLLDWEERVADTRIHGTTKEQVRHRFETLERPTLLPLPRDRFPQFHEGRRSVNRDGHLEVARAYYSTPPEYVGRKVWVRWDARLVRVFDDQWRQITVHCRVEPGRFQTNDAHIPNQKRGAVERGAEALLRRLAIIGPHAQAWSELVLKTRGVEGIRALIGFKSLTASHSAAALERACKTAVDYGACRLKSVKQLLRRPSHEEQPELPFLEEHPIIRPLSDYCLDSLIPDSPGKDDDDERETA